MSTPKKQVDFSTQVVSLIIKPLEACNFACTFCSSSYLVDDKKARLELEKIYAFLDRYPMTQHIFVVGGEPTLMPPSFYEEIICHIEENGLPAKIAMTSNLWDFYKRPEKWAALFAHPKMEVCTSFQYGEGRQISPGEIFTEDHFVKIYEMYKERYPHKDLAFLAVIDESNAHTAMDHVYLAKKLGTQCRLVAANASGKQQKAYPISKMYTHYIDIYRERLVEYEQTAIQLFDYMNGFGGGCDLSRTCDEQIRSLNPDGRYFSCGPMNDDLDPENEIDFEAEVVRGEGMFLPIQSRVETRQLKDECSSCELFNLCNGCAKNVKDYKRQGIVESHCADMLSIKDDLMDMLDSEYIKDLKIRLDMADGLHGVLAEYAKA
jgi:radical SAM protein with 4Fe4S-binding SPASM domain